MPFPKFLKNGETWCPKGKNYNVQEEEHYKWNPQTLRVEKVVINPSADIQEGEALSLKRLSENGIRPVIDSLKGFEGDMRVFKDSNIHKDFKAAFTNIIYDDIDTEANKASENNKEVVETSQDATETKDEVKK